MPCRTRQGLRKIKIKLKQGDQGLKGWTQSPWTAANTRLKGLKDNRLNE